MVSFSTYAWHITWIIFIIVGLVNKIVELIYYLKNNKGEDVE
jgi:hypothetical protein